jgi:molybdenum cofactor biosynthesis enzyme MoaA
MPARAERILVTERANARCEYCRAPQVINGEGESADLTLVSLPARFAAGARSAISSFRATKERSSQRRNVGVLIQREDPAGDERSGLWTHEL